MRARALACALTAALAPAGAAAEVTFAFEGEVTSVTGGPNPGISMGDPIAGTFTFDPNAAPSSSGSGFANYAFTTAPYGLEVTVGGFPFSSDPNAPNLTFGLFDDPFGQDSYQVDSTANVTTSGVTPTLIRVGLVDAEGVALSSTDLLPTPPPFVEFTGGSDFRTFRLETSGLNFVIDGEIQGLELPLAVPAFPRRWLPAPAVLAALAVVLGRRKARL